MNPNITVIEVLTSISRSSTENIGEQMISNDKSNIFRDIISIIIGDKYHSSFKYIVCFLIFSIKRSENYLITAVRASIIYRRNIDTSKWKNNLANRAIY